MFKFLPPVFLTTSLWATSLGPLPYGHGALVYDRICTQGPQSPGTACAYQSGYWVTQIQNFNSQAGPNTAITRIYPYYGNIDPTYNPVVSYNPSPSAAAYRSSFPNAIILGNIDGDSKSFASQNDSLAATVSQSIINQICNDANVDGVLFDMEPLSKGIGPNYALMVIFQQVEQGLKNCPSARLPNGRVVGIYGYVTQLNAANLKPYMGTNSFLAVPLYDLNNTDSQAPDGMDDYNNNVQTIISNTEANVQKWSIPYTLIVPAAASFGNYETLGYYDASAASSGYISSSLPPFTPAISMLNYMKTVVANSLSLIKGEPYYMGMDYWAWNQYVFTSKNSPPGQESAVLLGPYIPQPDVVSYLAKNGQ